MSWYEVEFFSKHGEVRLITDDLDEALRFVADNEKIHGPGRAEIKEQDDEA
jgi:hypothetical protein